MHAGPVLCEQGNPNQCYHPSSGHVLNVVKSNNPPVTQTTISATPSSFGFIAGGTTQIVSLTNNGPLEVYNVGITSAPGLGITASSDCPASLPYVAPNNVCHLTFTSGSSTGTTSSTIAGSNTNTLTENIEVNPEQASIAVTGGGTMTLYTNDVHAVGWMVITNNSSTITATNIAANFAPTALNGHLTQDASNCISVAPNTSCTLRFTVSGTTAVLATNFGVSGTNTMQVTGNLTVSTIASGQEIGDPLNGGKIATPNVTQGVPNASACGTLASTLYLVAASSDNSSGIRWSLLSTSAGATDITKGYDNTQTIIAAFGAGNNYAAGLCSSYQIDENNQSPCVSGVCYEGWYLPAQTELFCLYDSRTDIGEFNTLFYWSSTQLDSNEAWGQSFGNGVQNTPVNYSSQQVRCVRAITN